jgi:hypothetical protein
MREEREEEEEDLLSNGISTLLLSSSTYFRFSLSSSSFSCMYAFLCFFTNSCKAWTTTSSPTPVARRAPPLGGSRRRWESEKEEEDRDVDKVDEEEEGEGVGEVVFLLLFFS